MVHIVFRFKNDKYPKNIHNGNDLHWFQFDTMGDNWFRLPKTPESEKDGSAGYGLCLLQIERTGDWFWKNGNWCAIGWMFYRDQWGEGRVIKDNIWITAGEVGEGDLAIKEANQYAREGKYVP